MILGVILSSPGFADDGWEPAMQKMVEVLRSARITDIMIVSGSEKNSPTKLPWFAGTMLTGPGLADPLHAVRGVIAGSLPPSHHGMLICSSLHPEITQSIVVDILQGFWTSKKNFIIPVYGSHRGYPLIIGQPLYSLLAQVSSLDGLAALAPDEVLEIVPMENVVPSGVPASPGRRNEDR